MKRTILIALIAISISACAGVKSTSKGMVEDLGSPEKTALLEERVKDFWNAFLREDYDRIYYLYDPFFQARTDKDAFKETMGKIKYHKFEIKGVKVEGNVARVKVAVVYSLPKIRVKTQEFSQPETPTEFEETWLYIYDNWYREYYMPSAEQGIAYY